MNSTRKLAEAYAHLNTQIQHKWFLRLLSLIDVQPGSKCIDIGCGTGINTAHLADKVSNGGFVTGIDPDENRINIARQQHHRENVRYLVDRSTCIPTLKGGYDLIVSNTAMHWVNYEEKAITYQKVFDGLKDGGVFASCEVAANPHNFATFLPVLSPELRERFNWYFLTIGENEKIFKDLGFEILTMENVLPTHVSESLDQFLSWSTATLNDERIDFHKIYEENKEKLDVTIRNDGTVLSEFNVNYIVVKKT